MATIVPAILPISRHDLDEKLERLFGIASEVQVDIVDGRFAEPASWPYGQGSAEFAEASARGEMFPHASSVHVEVDLMVSDPEQVTGTWVAMGATRILAHAESTHYLPQLMTDFRVKYGHDKDFAPGLLSFGLALNIATDLALIEPYLNEIDYVQFMGIREIGKQGQLFDEGVLRKIATFRKAHPEIPVQVDGGVSLLTAPALLSAGVSRLVVGSALWRAPDLKEAYDAFVSLTNVHGLYE